MYTALDHKHASMSVKAERLSTSKKDEADLLISADTPEAAGGHGCLLSQPSGEE